MASISASSLSRGVASSCPRARMRLEQQFSLLRIGPAHITNKPAGSQILAQTRYRSEQIHRPEPPERQLVPASLANTSDLEMDAILEKYTSGALSESSQSGSDSEGIGGGPAAVNFQQLRGYARAVPLSPSYFTRAENFTDRFLALQDLFRRYSKLPKLPLQEMDRVAWMSKDKFQEIFHESVKNSVYQRYLSMMKTLHRINPDLKPAAVTEFLREFIVKTNFDENLPKPQTVDKFGRALGVGRRKESVARAWVVEGTGEVLVNGKSLSGAFARVHDRESATWALRSTERMDKYNVWALVDGGGTTGQAEALTLAVAKALVTHEPALKTALRKAGCITRDRRTVERKKPGHLKARKMPAWVKR
ncbi:37S ribosomal protein S9 [Sporothrix brasiliensis 5110]|uniref:Small ribosomal subunit protein uS9m n=1 Tax=Sporothrix brasiliensis 5110 TaxID=1398154 RepID=A0A0C2FC36_9PEZI|nr:37S ribosomal protein S9 [Sporothrix brasiliensis 5110]KIH88658.1 37S ribosomal protein S9 [Sporothrix brasiliensis 5110]